MPRRPGFEKPDIIIPRWVREKGKKFEAEYRARTVLARWHTIVGAAFARKVRPMAIRGDVLLYYTADSSWRQEMTYREAAVVSRVNSYAGCALIRSIRAVSLWERPEAGDILALEGVRREHERALKERDPYGQLKKMPVTGADEARARKMAEGTEDEDLKKRVYSLYLKGVQLKKAAQKVGYLPCPACGTLAPPLNGEAALCDECRRKREEKLRREIRNFLLEVPWARPPEVAKYVPSATAGLVSAVRSALVQELAGSVMAGDSESLAALQLVMLYRVIPPEELTEDQVTRALYELRFNLIRPADWHAPKRYSVIKRGREGKLARTTMAKGAHRLLMGRARKYHSPEERPKE